MNCGLLMVVPFYYRQANECSHIYKTGNDLMKNETSMKLMDRDSNQRTLKNAARRPTQPLCKIQIFIFNQSRLQFVILKHSCDVHHIELSKRTIKLEPYTINCRRNIE